MLQEVCRLTVNVKYQSSMINCTLFHKEKLDQLHCQITTVFTLAFWVLGKRYCNTVECISLICYCLLDMDAKNDGPPMLVDKTYFGLMLYYHTNFYQFGETSSYWSVKRSLVFLCFSLVNSDTPPAVYNRRVIKIENTVRSCNSWF